jgi:hypothetical protein
MVVARHKIEFCPGGQIRPDEDFIKKTEESIKKSGVKFIDAYMDAPSHVFYFVLETDDNALLNNAVEPLRLIGEVTISPVLKFFKEGSEWAKEIGIQK